MKTKGQGEVTRKTKNVSENISSWWEHLHTHTHTTYDIQGENTLKGVAMVTSLSRVRVRLSVGHRRGNQSDDVEGSRGVDPQDSLKLVKWVWSLLGDSTHGNANPSTVDSSRESPKPLHGNLNSIPHVRLRGNLKDGVRETFFTIFTYKLSFRS